MKKKRGMMMAAHLFLALWGAIVDGLAARTSHGAPLGTSDARLHSVGRGTHFVYFFFLFSSFLFFPRQGA
jgi:hypothetical protein